MALSDNETLALTALCNALIDEVITDAQKVELQSLLAASQDSLEFYVRFMGLSASLSHYSAEMLTGAATPPSPVRRFSIGKPLWMAMAAAIVAIAVLLGWAYRPASAPEAMSEAVAILTQAVDVDWDDAPALRAGSSLAPGVLQFKKGLVEIEFVSGARVLLKGPASFRILSSMEAYCDRGTLSAEVPLQAHGFKISSPRVAVVDLGTAFGFSVDPSKSTEVHVFKGEVNLHDTLTSRMEKGLTEGQAVRIDNSGMAAMAATPAVFPSTEEMLQRVAAISLTRQSEWQSRMNDLQNDPSLLLQYAFDGSRHYRTVTNSIVRSGAASNGSIVGCNWTEGRWPGKQALEFQSTNDRIRVVIPGEHTSLTMMAWVRVDSLDHEYSALLMCDGYQTGALHWQIARSGKIALGNQGANNSGGVNYMSPPVFVTDRLAQWVHLAVVFDGTAGRVSQYVDGKEVSSEAAKFKLPLRIGNAEIGNWNPISTHPARPIRNLNGRMDEFLIFDRALDAREILRLVRTAHD